VAALAATACSSTPVVNPRTLLASARQTIDAAQAIHFTLNTEGPHGTGVVVVGGNGDFARPDQFRGTLDVDANGFPLHIKAVSVGGRFWVQLPFSNGYSATDPSKYGFADPAKLINRQQGITSLLTAATSVRSAGTVRYQGELLDEVSATLPGTLVKSLLVDAAPDRPVQGRFGVDPTSHQVRQVRLTGPFFQAAQDSTFVLVLDHYGEHLVVTSPG